MSLPVISGVARLTDDPELRYAASGTAVCKLRLAFNSRKKNDSTGQWEDGDTFFVDGTVFNQEAEHAAESLQRGLEVVVTGRLKTRRYETKEGEKRSVVELMVDGIGPALKFATATVNKMQRSGGSTGTRPAPAADDPWATAPPAGRNSRDDIPPF
ncbi:single-stranded DNA-binding protein [Micromonospora inyonensis]|uniref:Single-stranded DNA-binding protein n=1 Tax=Micromonospora inyonensis TaxID=47866 RepID=A0A1C6R7A7_9ACTN|nr:single-stranded DNA-binding protein [Micromonospora inyonensis]SCL12810.1 single-strand DNA-binding protein [Micromonospora inyonensis]SCL21621.1 single-strand binding protein [Micromonospora inyonensis]